MLNFFIKILLILIALFSFSFLKIDKVFGQEENLYYNISLIYNSQNNSLKINPDNSNFEFVSLGHINKVNDNGEGSQFYVKLVDDNKTFIKFDNNSDKYFLGKWYTTVFYDTFNEDGEPESGNYEAEEIEIVTTVPYHPTGQKVNFYNVKTDQLALSIDVSQFVQIKPEIKIEDEEKTESGPEDQNLNPFKRSFNKLIIILPIIFLIAIIIAIVFWIKKIKNQNEKF
jgi:hypothetical protein